jgi:hypothetical protein
MSKLTRDDLVKLKEKVARHNWNLMFINPANKTFKPIHRGGRKDFFAKVKKNLKYYSGKELVEVRVIVRPDNSAKKVEWSRFVVSIMVLTFVLDELGNKIKNHDSRMLSVNFYLHELEKHPFTLKDIQLVINSVFNDHVHGDALSGMSFTEFVKALRKHFKKKS